MKLLSTTTLLPLLLTLLLTLLTSTTATATGNTRTYVPFALHREK
jgi:hypothetical protein